MCDVGCCGGWFVCFIWNLDEICMERRSVMKCFVCKMFDLLMVEC